ncbi:MAG: LLM class flavin-dependent oxidoreductase [Thaumarchaeota archaeon]|nr:LLM class flavin-dependent oxidoreductase [Nitrososphaerota archaeon]
MKFGIRLPQNGPFASLPNLLKTAEVCEDLGYDSVWVHDGSIIGLPDEKYSHGLSVGSKESLDLEGKPPRQYEALTLLSFIGARTHDIRLGTAATILPLWNPLILAKQCATVHELTERRLILGVAVGGSEEPFETFGVPYRLRGRITAEYLEMLRLVLASNPISSFHGAYIDFEGVEFYPAPRDLPIWYCGKALPAIERAASFCDGWLPGSGYTVERFREGIARLKKEAAEHGRDLRGFTMGLETYLCVAESKEKARRLATSTLTAKKIDPNADWVFVGSAADISEKLDAYGKTGVNYVEFKVIAHSFGDYLEMVTGFAKNIMPSFS